jgi:hypothetical protein
VVEKAVRRLDSMDSELQREREMLYVDEQTGRFLEKEDQVNACMDLKTRILVWQAMQQRSVFKRENFLMNYDLRRELPKLFSEGEFDVYVIDVGSTRCIKFRACFDEDSFLILNDDYKSKSLKDILHTFGNKDTFLHLVLFVSPHFLLSQLDDNLSSFKVGYRFVNIK